MQRKDNDYSGNRQKKFTKMSISDQQDMPEACLLLMVIAIFQFT